MARSRKVRKRVRRNVNRTPKLFVGLFFVCAFIVMGAGHYVLATSQKIPATIVLAKPDPNFHVETIVRQFFEDNDAAEMIPIIKCESHFKHYDENGDVLMNTSGSSATGVAQIIASKHPDPKIIKRYNKKFDMDLTPGDLDITTLEGNLGYALVLYKVNGVRDWECSRPFRF